MSIFQKIRELKFPFIAVVATMSFTGFISPANAAIPTVTLITVSNVTSNSATVTFTQDTVTQGGVPIGCAMLGRPANLAAPTAAYIFSGNSTLNGDLTGWTNNAANPQQVSSGTISFSGLTAGTNYVAYIACKDGGSFSSVYTQSFSTLAGPTVVTVPVVTFSGNTFTATQEAVWSSGTNSAYWLACDASTAASSSSSPVLANPSGCSPIFSAPAPGNTITASTLTTGTTYYASIGGGQYPSITLDNKYVARAGYISSGRTWSATVSAGGGSNSNNSSSSTASVRKPAPEFKINTRPAVSANGQTLSLSGENLSDITSVKVGGKEAKISKKASGEIVIEVPAGTEGYPDVEVLHAGGTITMQGLIQVIKPYALTRTLNLTRFVGDRPTLAGIAALEQSYLAGTTANILTCVATVASDASDADIANVEGIAKSTCQRVVNYSKYIRTADIKISKDGAAGSKPALAVTFDRTLDGK
jgi:hypothetical protein